MSNLSIMVIIIKGILKFLRVVKSFYLYSNGLIYMYTHISYIIYSSGWIK